MPHERLRVQNSLSLFSSYTAAKHAIHEMLKQFILASTENQKIRKVQSGKTSFSWLAKTVEKALWRSYPSQSQTSRVVVRRVKDSTSWFICVVEHGFYLNWGFKRKGLHGSIYDLQYFKFQHMGTGCLQLPIWDISTGVLFVDSRTLTVSWVSQFSLQYKIRVAPVNFCEEQLPTYFS